MQRNSFHIRGQSLIGIIIVLVVAGLIGGGLYHYFSKQIPEISEKETSQNQVLYTINKGSENIKEYRLEFSDGSTVFSLLEELAARENFEIETTVYPEMGVFIENINGFKGGTDNKWWQYWVNDKLGEVAADKKKVEVGDMIEWKFETPSGPSQ